MFILTSQVWAKPSLWFPAATRLAQPEVQLLILHVDPDELLGHLLAATDVESPRPIFFLKEPS